MRHNVTTPGGFFVGLGGIVAFCIVSSGVYLWVKSSSENTELRPQQIALGLAPAEDASAETRKAKLAETDSLLAAAGKTYNEKGRKPDLNNLADLRGVVRYREAQKLVAAHDQALNAPSSVTGKTVLEAAMDEVAREIAQKKPAASEVALMEVAPDPTQPPALPNYGGGGSKTMNFADPAKPAAASTPAAPEAAPATPAPTAPAPAAPEPARPPLLNSPEQK